MLDAKVWHAMSQACLMQNPVPGAANDNRFGCRVIFQRTHPAVRGRRGGGVELASDFAMAHEHCYIERSALLLFPLSGRPMSRILYSLSLSLLSRSAHRVSCNEF